MKITSKFSFKVAALAALGMMGAFAKSEARAPEKSGTDQNRQTLLKTAAGCTAPQAAIDLDINNVRARIMTAGNQWYDPSTGEARYEIPKGSRKNSLYAGALWVGGYDTQGQLKVTAQTYRSNGSNDYWTGPLDASNNIDATTCNLWDRFWKVNRSDITRFQELVKLYPNPDDLDAAVQGQQFDAIREWPAKGSITARGTNNQIISSLAGTLREYAPFVDVNADGRYDYLDGDYPDINGDQYIWRIYNDMGNVKTQTGTLGIGLEIQASAFAFATNDYLNDATFYNYRLINRGNLTLDSCYTATWTDADLGFFNDDYIGSDTARGLGILYNASAVDGTGQPNAYGNQVPMVGVDFFIGPKKFFTDSLGRDTFIKLKMSNFTYFVGSNAPSPAIGDPTNGVEFYRYMTGSNKFGEPFTNDFTVCGLPTKGYGQGPLVNFVYYGDPDKNQTWTECCSGNPPGDRRFVHSAGPFRLTGGGVTNDITIGACWASNVGGCPNTNFSKIRLADDAIQDLFDNNFRLIEGPEAPRMIAREMDGKVIFYLVNDSNSNNFQEKFGYDASEQRYRVSTFKTRTYGGVDSLYKFEGYRVFQLKDRTVTPANIFGEDGQVDQRVAVEVFQSDIDNQFSQLVNFTPRSEVTVGSAFQASIKVNGANQGIRHSFVIDNDAFAQTAQKSLVNYKTYYFVAIAYSANNFQSFDPNNLERTQNIMYLPSAKGQGGIPVQVVSVMPNPANGDMGTVLGADYGDGVKITRLQGSGNGGNALQLTPASEDSALSNNVVYNPVYTENAGPVTVRVVDPMRLVEADWQLSITGPAVPRNPTFGLFDKQSSWSLTMRDGSTPVTIFSERNLEIYNEQILEKYGFAVGVDQVLPPGLIQYVDTTSPSARNGAVFYEENNGLITSDVTFSNPSLSWLTGVPDRGTDGADYLNWIRSGSFGSSSATSSTATRDWYTTDTAGAPVSYDPTKVYERLLGNNTNTAGTWAPYMLTANNDSLTHAMMPTFISGPTTVRMSQLQSMDVVFTSDKSKWTRCMVVETSSDSLLSEGRAAKFRLRRHKGWDMGINASGAPQYEEGQDGMSWFPGYAVNQQTGERVNLFFGEDSYQGSENGKDMIWNPTSKLLSAFGTPIFGGKHFVWVTNTRYDSCRALYTLLKDAGNGSSGIPQTITVYRQPIWAGMPMAQDGRLISLRDGLIPTQTRLRFRVTRPYDRFLFAGADSVYNGFPLYNFSTRGMAPKRLAESGNNSDKQSLLDMINVVPNPYFAYAESYEQSRLDSRVRIINLPRTAEVSIYTVDGSMVRRLTKDNPNVSYIDWDLRNAKGLPVGSGMYLMHVRADGIGETILRFFGAIRPVDITTY